jgi:hypothetical protein
VRAPNQPPVLDDVEDILVVVEGEVLTRTFSASDPDGNALRFSASLLPDFCSLADNGDNTATLRCAPSVGRAGSRVISVSVVDDGLPPLSGGQNFTLSIRPQVSVDGPHTIPSGQSITMSARSSNPDVTFDWDFDGDGDFDDASGATPTFDTSGLAPGDHTVTVKANVNGVSNTANTVVTVLRHEWTYDNLRRITYEYVDSPFAARGLVVLVDLAEVLDARGRDRLADGLLDRYVVVARVITPHLLTPAERDELIEGAQALQRQ